MVHDSPKKVEYTSFLCQIAWLMTSREMAANFCKNLYSLEVILHKLSPLSTDSCLQSTSSKYLMSLMDVVYGSFSDKIFPDKVKEFQYKLNQNQHFYNQGRIRSFILKVFGIYFDISSEFALLSSFIGFSTGVSFFYWFNGSFDYQQILVVVYLFSAVMPIIFFAITLALSPLNSLVFGIRTELKGIKRFFFGTLSVVIAPFVPALLCFHLEAKKSIIFKEKLKVSKDLRNIIVEDNFDKNAEEDLKSKDGYSEILYSLEVIKQLDEEIDKINSITRNFKTWELCLELVIQSSFTLMFLFMTTSQTVINPVFMNWFVPDTANLMIMALMSL